MKFNLKSRRRFLLGVPCVAFWIGSYPRTSIPKFWKDSWWHFKVLDFPIRIFWKWWTRSSTKHAWKQLSAARNQITWEYGIKNGILIWKQNSNLDSKGVIKFVYTWVKHCTFDELNTNVSPKSTLRDAMEDITNIFCTMGFTFDCRSLRLLLDVNNFSTWIQVEQRARPFNPMEDPPCNMPTVIQLSQLEFSTWENNSTWI